MSEDIVTRLTVEAESWGPADSSGALCKEAAATIAALRAELAGVEPMCDQYAADNERLFQEAETLRAEVQKLERDAKRYRWLRDMKCNSFSVGKDEDHACNYMTASDWIDSNPEQFRDQDPSEVQRMRDANTIWRLQVYPNTPIGFYAWNGSTLDSVVDAAIAQTKERA